MYFLPKSPVRAERLAFEHSTTARSRDHRQTRHRRQADQRRSSNANRYPISRRYCERHRDPRCTSASRKVPQAQNL